MTNSEQCCATCSPHPRLRLRLPLHPDLRPRQFQHPRPHPRPRLHLLTHHGSLPLAKLHHSANCGLAIGQLVSNLSASTPSSRCPTTRLAWSIATPWTRPMMPPLGARPVPSATSQSSALPLAQNTRVRSLSKALLETPFVMPRSRTLATTPRSAAHCQRAFSMTPPVSQQPPKRSCAASLLPKSSPLHRSLPRPKLNHSACRQHSLVRTRQTCCRPATP